jgi:uncharacterized protein YyaL (SSP411 family)
VEGKFYVWTPEEVGAYAAELFSVTESGTFEHGTSVLQLSATPRTSTVAGRTARLLAVRQDACPCT